MKFEPKTPPRKFSVGKDGSITLEDCGSLSLKADQQVTLLTESGAQYDVARKDFGFYATPSMNSRLPSHGLRTALVCNSRRQFFIMLVEPEKQNIFDAYLEAEDQQLICWMDQSETLEKISQCFR